MDIFLSRPTWIPVEYQEGMETFLTQLNNMNITPRTLGISDYPTKAPLDEVIEILNSCQGAIILGVPQIEISKGLLKGKEISSNMTLGTEWNHLEAGIAYAKNIPILIIHHNTISRGVFDRGIMNTFLHSVNLSSSKWSMSPSINGAIKKWREYCVMQKPNFNK